MRLSAAVRILVLILLAGGSALIYAQDQRDEANAPREEKPAKQDEAKPSKQDEGKPPRDAGKPGNRGEAKQAEHAQHAGSQHGRIAEDKFRTHFGRQHTLVINRVTVVEGQPRFQYSGYWFTIVDAWPVGWAYTDECYIDEVDGEYFLFDVLHPGVRVAIVVVL